MRLEQRILLFAQLAAIAMVAVICYQVVEPFIPAILFAVVVCSSTWPFYVRLRRLLWKSAALGALMMVLLFLVVVIAPTALLAASLANAVTAAVHSAKELQTNGPIEPPAWLRRTPFVGEQLDTYWKDIASGGKDAVALLRDVLEPAVNFLLSAGKTIGESLAQMLFAAFIGFFFYRDGEAITHTLRRGLTRIAGGMAEELLTSIQRAVAGVVVGIFGTALAQAVVAMIGFRIAGVPGVFLLGAATFFLSPVPFGPPLLWGGATLWLVYQGSYGWAIFMFFWGLLGISAIDNVVRPYLISRTSSLPLLPVVLGVFGGVVAFGFIGIFIGPPILVLGLTLVRLWTTRPLAHAVTPSLQQ